MIFRLFIIFCAFVFLLEGEVFSQKKLLRDPFKPPFRKLTNRTQETVAVESNISKEPLDISKEPLDITVEGIIASDYLKQVIIDSEVYKVGDILKGKDARIVKIDKGVVSIMYNGMMYEETVKKQGRAK